MVKVLKLTSGGLLARNTLLSIVGQGLPLVVALFAIPWLIQGLGTERFGVLTLVWLVLSYFGLFDLGLGRALTQLMAQKIGSGEEESLPPLVWTALLLMMGLGVVGGITLALVTPWLVTDALKIPLVLQAETLTSCYFLVGAIPVVIVSTGLSGVLQAIQRVDLLNYIRIPLGFFTYLGPLLVLPFTQSLTWVVAVLVTGRIVGCLANLWLCWLALPNLRKVSIDPSQILALLKFGGWMTVTNIVGPVMIYMDRFFIGAVLSVAAVAYYATPYEMITKLFLLPAALTGVLFPAFATTLAQNPQQTLKLYERGLRYLVLAFYPLLLVLVGLAPEGLTLWVGEKFAAQSTQVFQVLAFGVLFNSLGQVAFALVQGAKRPDLTARLHLLELPCYLGILWWAIHSMGIVGAAWVWTARVLIDMVALVWLSEKFLPESALNPRLVLLLGLVVGNTALLTLMAPGPLKWGGLGLSLLCAAGITWFYALEDQERDFVRTKVGLSHANPA